MNVPNALTILRIILIPIFLYLIFVSHVQEQIWALVVFIIASLTDLLDGWMARKFGQVTAVGKFLDPLADKFLVISAFIALLILDPLIPLWMIVVVVLRDILLTFMRYLAMRRNSVLRTTRFGKIKTAFQMVSIVIIIMVLIVRSSMGNFSIPDTGDIMKYDHVYDIMTSDLPNKWLMVTPYILMAFVTIITALSGIRYIFTNRYLFVPLSLKKNGPEN